MTGPTRRREAAPNLDRRKIVSLYVNDGLSASTLAQRFQVACGRIAAILTEEGVALRNPRRKNVAV